MEGALIMTAIIIIGPGLSIGQWSMLTNEKIKYTTHELNVQWALTTKTTIIMNGNY